MPLTDHSTRSTRPVPAHTSDHLTPEQLARLDRASAMPVSYPYDAGAERQQRAGRDY